MMRKLALFIVGLALTPVCVVAVRTFFFLIRSVQPADGSPAVLSVPFLAFAGGMGVWLLVSCTCAAPSRAYVLAHELTHALWGALMGAKVSRLRVNRDAGSVTLSKTNVLIVLAPYFFPFYAVLIVLAYGIAGLFFAVERWQNVWLALVGFTWGFHLTFTAGALVQRQSDIRMYGRLFSYALILLLNLLGMTLWLVLTTSATWPEVGVLFRDDALHVGRWLWARALWARGFLQ